MGASQSSQQCIITPLEYPAMVDKLKKSCQQRLTRTRQSFRIKKSASLKRKLIEPMPRCSSFGCANTMLTPTKKPINDPTYALWKQTFEQHITDAGGKPSQKPLAVTAANAAEERHAHNISEAVSGQLTPKGFPSYTLVRKKRLSTNGNVMPKGSPPQRAVNETYVVETEKVRRRLSLRLPMFKSSGGPKTSTPDVVPRKAAPVAISSNYSNNIKKLTMPGLLPQKTPTMPIKAKPYYLSKVSREQAVVIEKLYQEIKDLEDYYGMRLDQYYY